MWVLDRTELILIGVVVGVVALIGLTALLTPEPVSSPVSTTDVAAQPEPGPEPEPAPVVAVVPEPEAVEPEPEPAPVAAGGTTSSTPIVDGTIRTAEYAHAMEAGGFRVYWSNDANVLRVGLFCPATGYLAIGIDPDHRMEGANFILGAVRNGQLVMRDDYGTGTLSHSEDVARGGTNDILAAAGTETNGQTTIEFVIPMDSGDPYDKLLVPGQTYEVLIAFHDTSDTFSTRHSQRGSGQMRLDD